MSACATISNFYTMNQYPMDTHQDYYISDYATIHNGSYVVDDVSATSSPSPVTVSAQSRQSSLPLMDQPVPPIEPFNYSLPPEVPGGYHFVDPYHPHPAPIVEFTDLTMPQDDRRRRRSQVKDKQAISSMHMVRRCPQRGHSCLDSQADQTLQRRRAQNRASQRAFRERKEKHAQELQRQLSELEEKHKELLESHTELDGLNKKLVQEIERLRDALRSRTTSPKPCDSDEAE